MEQETNNLREKKYELLKDDSVQIRDSTLYRIRALRSFFGR